jgi:hypothetical protein
MTFSEAIATAGFSLSPSPSLVYGSFSYGWDGTNKTVTVSPGGYALGQTVTHTITATDASTNVLVGTTTYILKPLNPSSGGGGASVGSTVEEGQTNVDGTRSALVPLLVVDSIKLAQPVGGEVLNGGSVTNITWTYSGNVSDVMIYYSIDGGVTYGLIKVGAGKNSPYSWKVPNLSTGKALVRITGRDSGGAAIASDVSGSAFSIVADMSIPLDNAPASTHVAMVTDMLSRTEAEEILSDDVHVDELVKVADDGDPTTDYDSTVYYIGLDAKRHPFPSSQVYFTWYENFDSVVTISTDILSGIALGSPVLVRPGTMMVKIQSDPRTFAVEPGNYTLRWIPNETVATSLYGVSWNKRILDIEPTYFSRFTMGVEMTSLLHPSGSVLSETVGGTTYYFDGVERRPFASRESMKANNFQDKYVITTPQSVGWLDVKVGSAITGFEDELFSLQR